MNDIPPSTGPEAPERPDIAAGKNRRREPGQEFSRVLTAVIGTLVFFAVLPVIALGFVGAKDNTSRLLRDHNEQILTSVVDRIEAVLGPVEAQLAHIQREISSGRVSPDSADAFDTFLLGTLAATPQVSGFGIVRDDLTVRLYNRERGDAFDVDTSQILRAEEAVQMGRSATEPIWVDVIWSRFLSQPILRLMIPITPPDGQYRGILIAAVTTRDLSTYLRDLSNELGAHKAYILIGEDRVLAHPGMLFERINVDIEDPLPRLEEVGDPILPYIRTDDRFKLTAIAPLRIAEGHWTWVNGVGQVFIYTTLDRFGPEAWTVGIHVPGEESRRSRWIVTGIAIGGGLFLLIALFASSMIGKRLARPILGLANAADNIAAHNFEDVRKLERGPIYEVNAAAAAFERTAAGMSLFESYVPAPVARELLDADGDSKPVEREGTVLFVDIAGFTTICEAIPADEVVEMLNAYFDAVAETIARHDGVITQFQGDAVLATFNLPVPRTDHAAAAIRAAREIAALVEQRTFAGQSLSVRVGLNTGMMVGGSVGAKGRLNYTVHGDAVNTAARLEGLNKDYGTTILASEQTVLHADMAAEAKRVGDLRIRGKLKAVTLYSLDPTETA